VKWEQEYVVEKMIRVVGISDEKVGNQPGHLAYGEDLVKLS